MSESQTPEKQPDLQCDLNAGHDTPAEFFEARLAGMTAAMFTADMKRAEAAQSLDKLAEAYESYEQHMAYVQAKKLLGPWVQRFHEAQIGIEFDTRTGEIRLTDALGVRTTNLAALIDTGLRAYLPAGNTDGAFHPIHKIDGAPISPYAA